MEKGIDLSKQVSRALNVVATASSPPLLRDVAEQSIPEGAVGRVPGASSPVSLFSGLTSMILQGNTHHRL